MERGQVLVLEAGWSPTSMLTVALTVLPKTGWTVKHGQRVRVHLGTSEVMARVVTLEGAEVAPGGSGWVQLRLEKPLLARTRDRLVIRSYSPVTTIGGGIVAEAVAPKRKKLRPGEADALSVVIHGEVPESLKALLTLVAWRGVVVTETPVHTGLSQDCDAIGQAGRAGIWGSRSLGGVVWVRGGGRCTDGAGGCRGRLSSRPATPARYRR